MRTALRVLVWTVVSLVVLIVLAGVALYALFDWSTFRDEAAAQLSNAIGQDVDIRGNFDVDLDLVDGNVRAQARDIHIQDPFSPSQSLVAIESVRAGVELRRLLSGNLVLDHVVVNEPRVRITRNEAGELNWQGWEMGEGGAVPVIKHFEVRDGRITYRDEVLDETVHASLAQLEGQLTSDAVLTARATGEIEARELRLQLEAERLEDGTNWRIDTSIALADTRLAVAGTTTEPDLRVELHAPNPRQLDFLPLPPLPHEPVHLITRLTRDQGHWWLDNLDLTWGRHEINGDVRLDLDRPQPMIYATLYLDELRLPEGRGGKREELIPPTPVPTEALRRVNLRANLRIGAITNAPIAIEDIKLLVELRNGRLVVRPLSADIAQGTIEGSVVLDASQSIPVSTVRLTLRDLNLAPIVPGRAAPITGEFSGRIDLRGRGGTVEKLVGNMNGHVLLTMREGTIAAEWIEALDLDLAEWLLVRGPEKVPTPVRCALIAFDVDDGVLRTRPAVLDTRDSLLTADGHINLATEQLDMTLRAFPKDFSLLSARGPIRLSGAITDPSITVLTTPTLTRGAVALALGALAGPLGAIIPLIEPGLANDRNCHELLAGTLPNQSAN